VTEVPKPLDTALDLLVYLPVGLAMTAAEELPKMAAKGRTRVNTQLTMARVVGQFAVSRGRQELERRFSPPAPQAPAPSTVPAPATVSTNGHAAHDVHVNGSGPDLPGTEVVEESAAVTISAVGDLPDPAPPRPAAAGPAPSPESLAIHGYDSLSASQVVQRLAGLQEDELDAVAAYESAHRGRRTILNRIDQLRGH
jgi:hypothetical protein